MSEEIKTITNAEIYDKCYICGEDCGKKNPKFTGNPRIYHLACAEKATEEARKKLNRKRIGII